jgi:hypothetical protein
MGLQGKQPASESGGKQVPTTGELRALKKRRLSKAAGEDYAAAVIINIQQRLTGLGCCDHYD